MTYFSALDKISRYLSPAVRNLGDFQIRLTGTQSQAIRVSKEVKEAWAGNSGRDVFGDFNYKFEDQVVADVIIKYPSAKIEMFQRREGQTTITSAANPEDELPITFFLRFDGDYGKTAVALQINDLVIDYFLDEHKNVVPVFWEVSQMYASVLGKNLVRKAGTLVPYRGAFDKPVLERVRAYLLKVINDQK